MPLQTDQIHKELDLIQAVITRMAQNSFQIKAWLIGVLSATVALGKDNLLVSDTNHFMAYVFNALLLVSMGLFWYLDAYYLNTERRYRKLYAWVLKQRPKNDDYLYDLETFTRKVGKEEQRVDEGVGSVVRQMFNKTLFGFYCLPFLLVLFLVGYNVQKSTQPKSTPKGQPVLAHPKTPTQAKPTNKKVHPK